jgi:hypothetical protein
MADITPEAVATRVEALRRASGRFDLLDCEAALQVADLAEALAARVAELEEGTSRSLFALMTERALAAEAENARLREEMAWALPILRRHLTHPNDQGYLAEFAALTTKEQTE